MMAVSCVGDVVLSWKTLLMIQNIGMFSILCLLSDDVEADDNESMPHGYGLDSENPQESRFRLNLA